MRFEHEGKGTPFRFAAIRDEQFPQQELASTNRLQSRLRLRKNRQTTQFSASLPLSALTFPCLRMQVMTAHGSHFPTKSRKRGLFAKLILGTERIIGHSVKPYLVLTSSLWDGESRRRPQVSVSGML